MKKLLVLALVLSMVGMATAGLKISVGGNKAYNDDLTVTPSTTVILDIFADSAGLPIGYEAPFYALVVQMSQGSIVVPDPAVALVLTGTYAGIFIDNGAKSVADMPVPAGMEGAFGGITIFSDELAIAPMTTIFDGIVFHCAGPEDAVIQLWQIDGSWGLGELMDEIVINQIPEPITMLLLGLGGLFIRRK